MAKSFNNYNSAKKTFGVFLEPMDASEYIYNKKAKASYCLTNNCAPKTHIDTESNLLLFKHSKNLSFFPFKNSINKKNLNINLITKLNLKDVTVVTDLSGNVPVLITSNNIPFLDYNIDPSGNLFGESVCGLYNYVNYMEYDTEKIVDL
jgi:hypothetical protein